MTPPGKEEALAKQRFLVISLLRIAGVAMVMLGLAITQGAVPWPPVAGYIFVAIGMVDVFLMPAFLKRKWGSRDA